MTIVFFAAIFCLSLLSSFVTIVRRLHFAIIIFHCLPPSLFTLCSCWHSQSFNKVSPQLFGCLAHSGSLTAQSLKTILPPVNAYICINLWQSSTLFDNLAVHYRYNWSSVANESSSRTNPEIFFRWRLRGLYYQHLQHALSRQEYGYSA